jgi:predicted nucleic acid-binding protein
MSGSEYLLDTNIVIGLLKGHIPALTLIEQAGLTLDKAAVSQITRMELLGYPKLTDDEEQGIRRFLAACHVCFLDEHVEAEAIRLRRTGGFKLPDAIVAGTAIAGGLRLLTLDQAMMQKLRRLGHEC